MLCIYQLYSLHNLGITKVLILGKPLILCNFLVFVAEPDDHSKPPPKPEPSLRNDHGFYSDISSSEDFSSGSEGEEEREGEGGSSSDEGEEWDSEAESLAEKSSSRYE